VIPSRFICYIDSSNFLLWVELLLLFINSHFLSSFILPKMVFGLSSRSRSAPSWANVESLCAYELDSRRRYARIEPNDIRLNILAASVSTALDLLGSHRGRIALAELAEDTFLNTEEVNFRRESPPACAQGFLRSIISTLPVIIVNDLGDINARTSRERWNQPPGRSFVGQQAALVEVNSRVSEVFIRKLNATGSYKVASRSSHLSKKVLRSFQNGGC
jgi:hypothetical protein